MQRVSAFLPSWDRRKSGLGVRTSFFQRGARLDTSSSTTSSPSPSSTASSAIREAFWPTNLDKECNRAASIVKSFSVDGFLAPEDETAINNQAESRKWVTKRLPASIIQEAAALAVFTCVRSGLWMTGSGGSGLLISRLSSGAWSPPSAIVLHAPVLSFVVGVDICDCILVINSVDALESITKPSVILGEDVGLQQGPLEPLTGPKPNVRCRDLGNTVFTYLKARSQLQEISLGGCILAERANENARFYGSSVGVMEILAGEVTRDVYETTPLLEVIKAAEGRTDFNPSVVARISSQSSPGDAVFHPSAVALAPTPTPQSPSFGIPNAQDPDPFGVLALEMAGLEIREAGSRLRPQSSHFEFNPSPTSPASTRFNRQSVDTFMSRSNRASYVSNRTTRSQMTDALTQTDVSSTPATTPSPARSEDGREGTLVDNLAALPEVNEVDYTKVDLTPLKTLSGRFSHDRTTAESPEVSETGSEPSVNAPYKSQNIGDIPERDEDMSESDKPGGGGEAVNSDADDVNLSQDDKDDEDEDEDEDEEPVVYEVAAAIQPARPGAPSQRVIHAAKGSIVTIKRPPPPPVPVRSAARNSQSRYSLQSEPPTVMGSPTSEKEFAARRLSDDMVRMKSSGFERGNENGNEHDNDDNRTIFSKHASSIFTATQGIRWSMAPTEDVSVLDDDGISSVHEPDTATTSKLEQKGHDFGSETKVKASAGTKSLPCV